MDKYYMPKSKELESVRSIRDKVNIYTKAPDIEDILLLLINLEGDREMIKQITNRLTGLRDRLKSLAESNEEIRSMINQWIIYADEHLFKDDKEPVK